MRKLSIERVGLQKLLESENQIEKIEKFGYDGKILSAVAFCQNIEHALYMKKEFSKKGYISETVTAKTNKTEQQMKLNIFYIIMLLNLKKRHFQLHIY